MKKTGDQPGIFIDVEAAEKQISEIQRSFGRQKYENALGLIQKVISEYPETYFSDQAYYLKGLVYCSLLNFNMDNKKAAAAFRMVISSRPVTDFDKLAQSELNKIK